MTRGERERGGRMVWRMSSRKGRRMNRRMNIRMRIAMGRKEAEKRGARDGKEEIGGVEEAEGWGGERSKRWKRRT